MRKRITKYQNIMRSDLAKYSFAEGSDFAVAENPINKEIKELTVKGNSFQEEYSGVNLFDKSSIVFSGGVTKENTETGVKLTSTSVSSFVREEYGFFPVVAGNQYLLKMHISVSPVGDEEIRGRIIVFQYNESGEKIKENYSAPLNADCDFTMDIIAVNMAAKISIGFFISYGVPACRGLMFEFSGIMLTEGTTSVPYEPFVGAIPSPSVSFPQSVFTAKNLIISLSDGTTTESVVAPLSLTVNGETVKLNFAKIGNIYDELIIKNGAVNYIARIGKIESYAGETVNTDFISSTGGLTTGAMVYHILNTEVLYDISDTNFGRNLLSLKTFGNDCTVSAVGEIPASYLRIKYSEKI